MCVWVCCVLCVWGIGYVVYRLCIMCVCMCVWQYCHKLKGTGRVFEVSFKGKQNGRKSEYAENEKHLNPIIAKLAKQGLKQDRDYEIHRNKGLGENDDKITWESMMNPLNRTLRRINVEDVEKSATALDLAMGPNVANRKQWIEDNYDNFDQNLLDV